MSLKKRLADEVVNEHSLLRGLAQAAQALQGDLLRGLDSQLRQSLSQIENDYSAAVQRSNADLDRARRSAAQEMSTAIDAAGLEAAPWTAPGWANHKPPANGGPPTFLRLGDLRYPPTAARLPTVPALLPLIGQRHVLVSFDDGDSQKGAGVLTSLAWRIAAFSPAGSYRFVLLDPLDRGRNLASLLKLPEAVRGPKIFGQEDEVEQALFQLTRDIEEVIQRRLLNTYPDIEAYNAANPDVAVPYRFLVLIGFPRGFSSRAADHLATITRTGRQAGCYVLAGLLRGEKPPHNFDFAAMQRRATFIGLKDAGLAEWNDVELAQTPVQLDAAPPPALIDNLAGAIQPLVAASATTIIPFTRIAVRKAKWWQASSAGGLEVEVGIDESGATRSLAVGRGAAHHVLVGGTTGSGKTNLLHLLILMLAIKYSPDELELYLIDFKQGVEFQDYATHALPHAKAVVLEAEREFGLSVLQRLVEEMDRRSQVQKAAGASDLEEYRRKTGRPMPRVLLIIDEYVVLFAEDDKLAMQASEALANLVMRGRSYGIHILLSAQRPASTFLSMSQIKSQMGLRIALKCRPEDSTLILGDGNEKAARISQIGVACVTDDPDRIDATVQVKIARVEPDERGLYLRGLQEFTRLRQWSRAVQLIIFSRDAATIWAEGSDVKQRLADTAWTPLPAPRFYLGQPLRIAGDIAVTLPPQQSANLIVLGSDEQLATRLLVSALLGLSITVPPHTARLLVIGNSDPSQLGGQALEALRAGLPHPFSICARQEALDAVTSLAAEVDDRLSRLPQRAEQSIFLVIVGLQRWLEARGTNSYTPGPAADKLTRIFQQGPLVGVHTLLWTDRLSSIGGAVGSGNQHDTLAQFGHRVALHLAADESMNFLGAPQASKLPSERAFYRQDLWPADVLEKFKPYTLPDPDDLEGVLRTIRGRWAGT